MKKEKLFAVLFALLLTVSIVQTAAASYDGERRVVIGNDLSTDQIITVYELFGIERGTVQELTVTNAEERTYLEDVVPDSAIGTRAISCVYLTILPEGDGLSVQVTNINWCTEEIYKNALMTAGIYDADVIVAAPFNVSGTAALTGIYKAYEDITGEELSEEAKAAATQELVISSSLAEDIGDADAAKIVNELKKVLGQTAEMTDEELKEEIKSIAESLNSQLTDEQVERLVTLVRTLEKMDTSELIERVESIKDTAKSLSNVGQKMSDFFEGVKSFFASVANFFGNLFGGKQQ